ncbi:uncharacterized protein [Macrobrachium rosenbergii]|uniref:uncharacterized protein n=1 Tax=Macrobrachium rosenbergii TaxID=79674 RepID=UPI0034D63182
MSRLQVTLMVAMTMVTMALFPAVDGFSLGRLFPASRSGVRGTLISSLQSSTKTSSNALKEALKEAATTTERPKLKHPVTNSPIYYIRLPPSPYVYMPGLGYVSPNTDTFKFIRPGIDFVNNGRPSSIFHFKGASTTPKTPTTTTTTPAPATTTTTAKPAKPSPTKKPSSIHWLTGTWMFNGRPSNLFIFNSPNNPDHFDMLHKKYNKSRVLF